MKAIGFNQPLPISDERSLVDIELPDPEPGPNDLLVAVEAIAVNPADTKVRASWDGMPWGRYVPWGVT